MADKMSMGSLIVTFLVIIVALALTPSIGEYVWLSLNYNTTVSSNVTGVAATLIDLVTLFWVILVLSIGVVAVYYQLRGVGEGT